MIGAFVQANCGRRPGLMIAGVPVGKEITENAVYSQEAGSIIIVVATDAPLLPHQLKRLARRASLGLARTGSVSGNGSGDLSWHFPRRMPMRLIRRSRRARCRQSRTIEWTLCSTRPCKPWKKRS